MYLLSENIPCTILTNAFNKKCLVIAKSTISDAGNGIFTKDETKSQNAIIFQKDEIVCHYCNNTVITTIDHEELAKDEFKDADGKLIDTVVFFPPSYFSSTGSLNGLLFIGDKLKEYGPSINDPKDASLCNVRWYLKDKDTSQLDYEEPPLI
jgi:hypothetical protein